MMSSMGEAVRLFAAISEAWRRQRPAVLAVVASVRGSAYRRPGAKMVADSAGIITGTVSGGCLEGDIAQHAPAVIAEGRSRLLEYDLSENTMWSLGIGCKGRIGVLVVPAPAADDFWQTAMGAVAGGRPVVLVWEVEGSGRAGLAADGRWWGDPVPAAVAAAAADLLGNGGRLAMVADGARTYLVDPIRPADTLIVAGAGHDAAPVVRLAQSVGFAVTVLDARPAYNTPERFGEGVHHQLSRPDSWTEAPADAWWLVMNHHQRLDEASLKLALASRPRWVGVLGPLERTREMLAAIGRDVADGPLFAPVGLDLGAESPEEVAVSIVAHMMASRSGRPPSLLHGRQRIHQ